MRRQACAHVLRKRLFVCTLAAVGSLAARRTALALTINAVYDSTVTSNPNAAAIENAFGYVGLQYQNLFSDAINVRITVTVATSGLGQSTTQLVGIGTYAQTRSALVADASSADDSTAVASLPTTDPTPAGSAFIFAKAEAKAEKKEAKADAKAEKKVAKADKKVAKAEKKEETKKEEAKK